LKDDRIISQHFSHPSEEMFARVMDFYGIEWIYEPRIFPLEFDETGRVTLAFKPDFYLPEQDLYIELTTLRPQLSTIKNHKMKLMADLYPDIKIKLLKRREVRGLMVKYGLAEEAEQIQGREAQVKVHE
jgi:hypoxanthine phosphoribosyltransferase